MRKILLCSIALLALIGAPAMAADLPVRRAPPPPPPPVWSGFYIGVHGGWGSADVDTRFNDFGDFNDCVGCSGFSHNFDGGLVGGHIGYNWQLTVNWLFGLEIAGTWSGVSKSVLSPFDPEHRFEADIDWLFTFTPRLGVTAGNWLFYIKGGLAAADFSARFIDFSVLPNIVIEGSDTRTGWTIGGGFEVLTGSSLIFGPGGTWVFGIEGNYYDFGSIDVVSGPLALRETNHTHDITMWSVLGRLSWKFGGVPGAPVASRY
jgi:outer membrane immunogenic protein